jgi:hypothetical protein
MYRHVRTSLVFALALTSGTRICAAAANGKSGGGRTHAEKILAQREKLEFEAGKFASRAVIHLFGASALPEKATKAQKMQTIRHWIRGQENFIKAERIVARIERAREAQELQKRNPQAAAAAALRAEEHEGLAVKARLSIDEFREAGRLLTE